MNVSDHVYLPSGDKAMMSTNRVVGIVQARMGSTRLPGKVLAPILDVPMLQHQLERVKRAKTLSHIIVATSDQATDDPIVALCETLGVDVYRGSESDVLSRFTGAIASTNADVVVRITADCPLISPHVIDSVVNEFLASDADYVSNTLEPTFPDGVDVEVVRASVLVNVESRATDPAEREHVTLGVYCRPEEYIVKNFAGSSDLSELRWTVDSPEDFEFVTWVYSELYGDNPEFDVPEILGLLAKYPGQSRSGADSKRNAALDGLDTGAMQHKN